MESYSVQAVLSAVDKNFSKAFKDAANSTQTLQQSSGKALTAVGKSSALVGAAVGVMAGKAIKSYGDFQNSINQAAVIGGSSNKSLSGDMKGLEKVALSLGKTLPVSADDAAQAMVEMARNGASVGELKKEFPAIAKAAAVSGEDMTATATTVQQAMNIWGGGAKNAAKDSATLAVVANRSNATIGDMGQVFANVGTTAKNMGFSLKDVGIAAGLMTNAGIPAAQASQDLNHAFSQMVKPSKSAKATMQELGLSYTDAQGNMKPLKQIIQETAKATEGMSGAQKTAALNTLFGAAGAKAIAPLIDSVGKKAQKSGKGWDSFSSSIDKAAGSTAKANKYLTDNSQNMSKNVGQSINQMLDAFDALIKTSIGSIAPQIKTVANAVGDFATWLTTSKSPMAGFVKGLIAWSPIIAGILLGFGALSLAVAKLIPIFTTLMTVFRVGKTLLVIATGSQAAASALTFMAGESKLAALALKLLGGAFPGMIIIAAITAVVAALVWFFTQTKTGQAIWQGFMSFLSSAWTAMSSFLIGIWNTLGSVFSTIWQALVPIIQNLVTMLQSIWTGYVTSATAVWNGLVSIASGVWNLLKSVILGPILLLIDLLTGNWSQMQIDAVMIWNNIKISLGQIVSGIVTAVSGYFKGLGQMLSGIWNSVNSAASSIWNAISSTIMNLANSAINGVKSAWSGITGWASSLWNGVKSAVSSIWGAIVSVVSSMASNAFNSLRGAWSGVSGFVSGLWNSARSAISGAWSGIVSTIRSMASNAFGSLRSAWGGVVGWVSGIWNSVKGAIMGAMNFSLFGAGSAIMHGFLNGLRSVWGAITSFVGGIASWIRRHKGPIQYDRKLLIPAGNAIMTGLNAGLVDNFKTVQKNVSGMAGSILDAATSVGNLATNAIGDPINALNNNIGGSYSSVMTLDHTSTTQPANITIGFDKHGYTAYVDDINNQQGKTALLKRNNSVQL
ncbi:phage tail tape measure protein [Leuconostoc mesenteroides]|uniref:phage tail tape measure protein n=1 Tax=Leuconostoc mesenteroides TaxID=1245 RepID=UPI00235EEA2A|nr:phage tail tape measure protein [Leuconostoc mesenteroides]